MITNFKEFKEELANREVSFSYTKKNGEKRYAKGTLNVDIMGTENVPKGTDYDKSDEVLRYFDIDCNGWRSCIIENIIEWE